MEIKGSIALVTGASRGIGLAFARALLSHGAAKVYAGARRPQDITEPELEPLLLDVTDHRHIEAAAARASDASIVINNAGIIAGPPLMSGSLDGARLEMEVNFLAPWAVSRAFAPVLAANGGGALVNMLSVTSFFTNPENGSYGASKAAEWSLTNGARIELAGQGTLVVGVHAGFIDTEMVTELARGLPKLDPLAVVRQVFDAVEAGQIEVLAGERTRRIKSLLPDDHEKIYPAIQAAWDAGHPRAT